MKVRRAGKVHSIKELDVKVMLEGGFHGSYTRADNRLVVATDSIKNTINVLAKTSLGTEAEVFGIALGEHFLNKYKHISRVTVDLRERCWSRICIARKPHNHSFTEKNSARPFARIVATRKKIEVESGIEELLVLKSTGSGFEEFLRDEFTTLPETKDRILATKLKATWTYARKPTSYTVTNERILDVMLRVFANNFSPSVQVTLFQMGGAALKAAPEISKVHIALPNKHCLLVNLAPFGQENKNELFVPTDEPHGQIEGTVAR